MVHARQLNMHARSNGTPNRARYCPAHARSWHGDFPVPHHWRKNCIKFEGRVDAIKRVRICCFSITNPASLNPFIRSSGIQCSAPLVTNALANFQCIWMTLMLSYGSNTICRIPQRPCEFIYSFPFLSGFLLFLPPRAHHRRDQVYLTSFLDDSDGVNPATITSRCAPFSEMGVWLFHQCSEALPPPFLLSSDLLPLASFYLHHVSLLLRHYSRNASNLSIRPVLHSIRQLTASPTAPVYWLILAIFMACAQVFSSVSLPIRLRFTLNFRLLLSFFCCPFPLHTIVFHWTDIRPNHSISPSPIWGVSK